MNVRVTLIALSLIANGALGAAWLSRRPAAAPAIPVAPEPTRAPESVPLMLSKEVWGRLADADDRTFVARLREQGFPPAVVRALASARIATRYAEQKRALRTKAPVPYWRGPAYSGSFSSLDAEGRAELRRINREQAEQLRALVGDEGAGAVRTWYESAFQRQNYGYLPPEKGEALRAIQNDYRELRAQVWDRAKGVMLAEDRRMQAYLDQQERADMAKVLSAEELAEYDLRSSPSATTTRSRLQNFEPTEAEYRALVKLQLAFDARFGSGDTSAEQEARRRAATPELRAQIAQALGSERYARYEVVTDGSYGGVVSLVKQLGLSGDSAFGVVQVKVETMKQADLVQQDQNLPAEERAARLSALAAAARMKLAAQLGADGLERYEAMFGPYWLPKLEQGATKGGGR
ncbi:hypothetical protein [Opitutus sp. ER46]|uniref:hypothetical protein n=1 Tax=Opitutus sp. ER46 TaxID=2161864 RepID=UPI000D304B72|nr:hypothetical protein [Opitutus sp. ER46]PTX96544.1 hypothetical protein DB354_07760 [Opitutus sp. ER46]